jgi:phosphate transport system substrate-binding protein
MRNRRNLLIGVVLAALGAAGTAQSEEIRIGGGGAALITIFQPAKPGFEAATGIALVSLQSSPKGGLVNLLAGMVDVAVAAHSLESMIEGATRDGVRVDASALQQHPVGFNRTVLLVHPSNRVSRLSRDQIKDIFTGRLGNWKDVGGDDRDIIVVWGKGTPGQNADFTRRALEGESVARDVLLTTNYIDIRDTVAATPEAVGIDPFGIADASVKVIEADPPLTTPIIAVTLGKPAPKVQRLLDYVTGEGRRHTRQ